MFDQPIFVLFKFKKKNKKKLKKIWGGIFHFLGGLGVYKHTDKHTDKQTSCYFSERRGGGGRGGAYLAVRTR